MLMSIAAALLLQASPSLSPAMLVDGVRRLTVAQDNDQRFEALTGMLRERNLPFTVEPFTIPTPVGSEPRTRGRNIVVSLGEGGDDLVIGAHYDAVRLRDGSLSRGAVDNGASSVMLVYLAETLRAERLSMRVRIVWFDMEETGHVGSLRYIETHASDRIRAMLNFDINAHGETIVFGAPPEVDDVRLRRALVRTCADEAVDCLRLPQFPQGDDRSFGKARIPALSIGVLPAVEAHQLWLLLNGGPTSGLTQGFAPGVLQTIHTADDVLEKVDGATMARMHRFALALVRQLNAAQPSR